MKIDFLGFTFLIPFVWLVTVLRYMFAFVIHLRYLRCLCVISGFGMLLCSSEGSFLYVQLFI